MRSLTLSSVSTTEPVSLDEAKNHLRIQTTAEDTQIQTWITVARKQCENLTRRALVSSSWLLVTDDFCSDAIVIPRPPLSSLSSLVVITYTKTTGDSTTVSSTVYDVDYRMEPAQIRLAYDQSWPTDVRDQPGSVSIAYKSGYSTATIPQEMRQWILERVGVFYNHRESLILDPRTLGEIPRSFVDGLLDEYRIIEAI